MREMNSFAAAMSSGVGGPFLARTSCTCSHLSNAAAKPSPGFPVVRARAIVSRRHASRLVSRDRLLISLVVVVHGCRKNVSWKVS